MLEQYLQEHTISLQAQVASWQQALEIVARPLLAQAIISPHYLPAIIREHEKLGAWYVLAPGLAMPHTRPHDGALATGLSLLKLTQGVCFGHEAFDPVDIIIMLAAEDNHSHINVIAGLAELFSCESDMTLLHQASSKEEIVNIIHRY